MALYGYDMSKWQNNVVSDKDFMIVKATEGNGYVDPTCDAKYQMNKAAGKLLSHYHYARPDLNKGTDGALSEARFFVNNTKNYFHESIPALDWEQPGTTSQVSWAKAWLDEVYRLTGVRPLIYMSASVVNGNNWASIANDYGLWIAGYPAAYNVSDPPVPTVNAMPYKTGAWKFWAIWQYSSGLGKLDHDIANMDATGWKKYAGAITSEPAPAPEPTPEPDEPEEPAPVSGQEPTDGGSHGTTQPEQPVSTDMGLTTKEWDKILENIGKSIELGKDTANKYGLKIPMSNKVYDVLKVVVAIVLPVISTLYVGLANIWGFGFGEQVDKTIQLVITALNALLGIAIVKSSSDYHKGA